MTSTKLRYRGCLLGLACGDALGGPHEFVDRSTLDADFPGGIRDFGIGGWLDLQLGEITDDTQMALAIARSLAHHDSANMEDIVDRFVEWYQSSPKDIGNTTLAAIQLLADGMPWQEAGLKIHEQSGGKAAGNGAVMRCAPIALRFAQDDEALSQVTTDVTRATHADPRCVNAATALNTLIANLLNGCIWHESLAQCLQSSGVSEVAIAIESSQELQRDQVRSGGYVVDTLQAAIWACHVTNSFEDAVSLAVGLGEDTDTTGAVAGAIAGAMYGAEAIPTRWRDQVQHRAELTDLAERLQHRACSEPT